MKSNYKRLHKWHVDVILQEATVSPDDTVRVFSDISRIKKAKQSLDMPWEL